MCATTATPATAAGAAKDTVLAELYASRVAIVSVLAAAAEAEADIDAVGDHLADLLSGAAPSSFNLQSQAMAARALSARIDRAVAPAEPLLAAFRRVSSLAGDVDSALPADPGDAIGAAGFVGRVDELRDAIEDTVARGEEAVRKIEEAVGFLGRTKAVGRGRVRRLTEAAAALRAVYETEAEEMRFEGPLDEALLGLQDLFEAFLLRIKHPALAGDDAAVGYELGTDEEVDAAARMARTLACNDCLDICLDIYVKARYRRAAKAMMRLNPAYLKSYTPEAVDAMEWESLESAMALWSPHFHVAVAGVLPAERRLCERVLAHLPPALWPECFAKIAARIVAAFFRFADGVSASAQREPQRLFKLLDMLDAVAREKGRLDELFSGESPTLAAIRERAREVEGALARAAAAVFYEFGLRVETQHFSGAGAGADVGHVPKIVRYAVNYLKCLASDDYRELMGTALRRRGGGDDGGDEGDGDGSEAEGGGAALAEAASNVLEALHRHVEAARRAYGDAVAAHVMAMNAYWYIYMRARGSELAKMIGEETMRRRYKASAEEAAWEYQDAVWSPLVRLLGGGSSSGAARAWPPEEAREKAAAFAGMLEERVRRHGGEYKIPDGDLREQIKVAATKAVRGAYAGFLKANEKAVVAGGRREHLPVDAIEGMMRRVFDEMGNAGDGDGVVGSTGRSRSGGRSRRESRNLEVFEC